MKRVLILPRETSGIVDIRETEHFILDDITYLEEIYKYLIKNSKSAANYKFCQFEEKEIVPFFVKIKDKLSNGFAEFEISRVKFKELPLSEEKVAELIESKHLQPILEEKKAIKGELIELFIDEWTGATIDEPTKTENVKRLAEINKKIDKFDTKKHMNEVV